MMSDSPMAMPDEADGMNVVSVTIASGLPVMMRSVDVAIGENDGPEGKD